MKTMATWFTAAVMVAAVVQGCSVTVNDPDGGIGGSGGSGGSTGGAGGTGGAAGSAAGTGGTGGASGAAGSAGTGGSTSDAGGDGNTGGTCPQNNPNDAACTKCGYTKCVMTFCACNAVTSCRTPMLTFLDCASRTGADFEACASTFIINANPDSSGGGLANDLGECMLDECIDTCEGREASARTAEEKARIRALFNRH
ncbi:MAG: hypothetical protein ABW133_24715 [Polyangiaceae bacterium]